MAEYYPLLAKAVGRLPNSTPDSRRVVYERARKALIGQLRTQHPPVPDEDIERESVELDRAVERLEAELANGGIPGAPVTAPPPDAPAGEPSATGSPKQPAVKPTSGIRLPATGAATDGNGAIGPAAKRPIAPLRTRTPGTPPPFSRRSNPQKPAVSAPVVPVPSIPSSPPPKSPDAPAPPESAPAIAPSASEREPETPTTAAEAPPGGVRLKPPRADGSRPIAPQPRASAGPKRRLWIIPVGIGVVVAVVAVAAWKLRDRPETIARTKPVEKSQTDAGKIAERVGVPSSSESEDQSKTQLAPQPKTNAPAPSQATGSQPSQAIPQPNNPEIPVAHRAALLVEAPDEPNKVKTFLGTVVWKLNNVPQGPNDTVGLAVEADIELPDDKMKATVTFEKNMDASLAASHTIKVQFTVEPGSFSGNVKQISTPQMRPEASPSGEALAGVSVPVVPNTFLVGLSPGNAEAANLDLMRRLQWIDIPMLLDSGKIAKLTFEKSDSGQRDLSEAFSAWQK